MAGRLFGLDDAQRRFFQERTAVKEPIISVSGLRGVVGESLSPELAMRFACAFAGGLEAGPLVVTRDSRNTGAMLADAIRSGLVAVGRTVLDAGIAATPTTGVLIRQHQAVGGIQISASHNPSAYNGMKLFSQAGSVLDSAAGEDVIQRYRGGEIAWVAFNQIGEIQEPSEVNKRHLELVLATVDVQRIRQRRFKVVLDSNHGAGSLLGLELLHQLGCDVVSLGDTPDGEFAHPPEPTAENLADVGQTITDAAADIGFCQDPDADRLALIDHTGHYVGEEYTLALCLDHVLASRAGPIVTNCATSRMAEDLANKYGVPFFRSAVGEANVVAEMRAQNAAFGGEGNGGPIDPRVGLVRDSFVGMALLLDGLATRQTSLREWVATIPGYAIHKTKIALDRAALARGQEAIRDHFSDAEANDQDGLRLDWPDRWLLIRASNTEPIARIIAEAPNQNAALQLCDEAAHVLARADHS
jgi:phosphomannomutase